ncbi:MAG TPA: DUF1304 domain-containing protein [Leptospiraceae bacterium]|nr:DUF1304 domain-containing protein [Leptospiraceae bacterium]HMY66010.1 DUF1304 domain-containing protein [Leptospiraceae bacterium]HMZ59312.1 DUF1304 domain-containing protein [Leptospiraceae bacterium]HNF14951.1 DUF1304 domain-containing protein [Leptospiraceae bacterium]HNF23817.1 DUF1304 domain-containing protein [Leptospiraceae bacterium]
MNKVSKTAAAVLTGLNAFIHSYILVLEMFLWNTPYGQKAFNMTAEKAEITSVLAANQGLYNGFLAAGLIWSFFISDLKMKKQVRIFFLACICTAGIYGAATAAVKILFIQSVPSALAILAILALKDENI